MLTESGSRNRHSEEGGRNTGQGRGDIGGLGQKEGCPDRRHGADQHGRTLGIAYLADVNKNSRLLTEGWAWHFKTYNSDKKLAALETAAREGRKGLWQHAAPIPPWAYRALKNRPPQVGEFWLNVSSGVRHNSSCKHYGNTKGGRKCEASEGKPCGICGG